ncbi:MAG: RNA-binding S4 domain-containing protein [Gemmatimonadales bacterium]
MEALEIPRIRLDKWLWAARFYKTRSLAAQAIDGGRVQVNGGRVRRAKSVAPGDEIRIRQGPREWHIVVRALAERRGSGAEAAALFEETGTSKAAREKLALQLKGLHSAFVAEDRRPTKRERRQWSRLKREE